MKIHPAGYLIAVVIASSAIGGVYVAAATTANSIAATFSTTESDLHARQAEAESAMKRASVRYAAARGNCEQYKYAKRDLCNSAARKDERSTVLRDAPTEEKAP